MKNRDFITCIQSVLQLMDEGVHIVDTEGRSIVYNRAMARLEKMETRDVLRKPFSEVFKDLTPENLKKSAQKKEGLTLVIKEVPEVLATMKHIKWLKLKFTDEVVIPDWFYQLKIDKLIIEGKMSKELEKEIKKHFPKANIWL